MRYELWLGVRYLFAKRRERFISVIALLLIGAGFLSAASGWAGPPIPLEPTPPVQASIRTQDRVVVRGQDVMVELEMRNVSKEPLSLYRDVTPLLGMPGQIRFLVMRENGEEVAILQPIDEHTLPPPEAFVRLQPGASFTKTAPMNLAVTATAGGFEALAPGRYDVTFEVTFSEEGKLVGVKDAWAGSVRSNTLRLEIVETGD